jgi:histidinol dehydrogenase
MMRRIELGRGQRLTEADLRRSGGVDAEVIGVAARIVDDVRTRGDEAVREYTKQLDGVQVTEFAVSALEIEEALAQVEPEFLDSLAAAAGAIEDFHRRQVQQSWFTAQEGGIFLGQKVTPVRRVGIYVPGGRAKYPSSVLMNAIPAVVAGVDEIAMVVPPDADGRVNPYTLAAASIAGIDEIYRVGGAQAIAALAYGTESIPKVDKITGPGNAYVTAAKKLVMGDVGIDMLAGPSEVLVLADESAIPAFVAIDLMAQAEHDPRAATYLVTIDPDLPDEVEEALRILLAESPRGEITERSLTDNGVIIVCPDIVAALDTVDMIAPEHLEVQCAEPFDLLGQIRNAGAIFLGPWTPESVGDYVAGPNHVLPTGGTARFSSPLSVDDFVKKSSVISYSFEALEMDAQTVLDIAEKEGLWAHGRAVSLRMDAVDLEAEMLEEQDECTPAGECEPGEPCEPCDNEPDAVIEPLEEDVFEEEEGGS